MQIQQPHRYLQQETAQHSHSNRNKSSTHLQVLCRITFDLDQNSQELIVFQNASLQQLTQQLIDKLKNASLIEEQDALHMTTQEKDVLKGQIKLRIEEKMEQNSEKSLQAARWRNKLKDILEEKIRTPMDSLVSPSTHRLILGDKNKSVSYFKYNQPESEDNSRQREIIERMKVLEKEIKGQSKSKESKRERLYDLGKQTEQIKEYLYKAHEYQTLSQELAQCTFHPNIRKINTQANTQPHSDVFARLYNQAADKKEKIKRIASQIQSRKLQQQKSLNFIPKINQCSKEIVMAKKQQKINVYDTLYQQVNILKEQKNKFQPEYTFHPTISAKSQQILKDKSTKRLNPLKHEVHTSKKNIGRQSSQVSLQWFGQRNQYAKSPIKDKLKKRTGNSKANKVSQKSLEEWKEQQETIKKTNYQREKEYQSEQTLKQNIFCKKPFKKNKNHNKNQHCYVQSKDIKRQKITILDQTQVTCNTEQSLPTKTKEKSSKLPPFQKSIGNIRAKQDWQNESEISIVSLNDSKGSQKDKRRGLDPFAFFKQKQKQKSSNKQNIKQCKQEGIELQFHKRKNKIFQDIFTYLLYQAKLESQITYQAIVSSPSIPQSLRHVFYPMAQEMRELQVGLDQEEFVWSLIRIFDSLSLQQRGWILGWGLKLQQPALSPTKLR